MRGGFAPRFAIEAGFLVLLGVGAGVADLRPAVIVAVLAGAWVLVSLLELAVWRGQRMTFGYGTPPPAPVEPEPVETDPEPAHGWDAEEVEQDDSAYPLRSDAGATPSEEVEAYTRVLGDQAAEPGGESPDDRGT